MATITFLFCIKYLESPFITKSKSLYFQFFLHMFNINFPLWNILPCIFFSLHNNLSRNRILITFFEEFFLFIAGLQMQITKSSSQCSCPFFRNFTMYSVSQKLFLSKCCLFLHLYIIFCLRYCYSNAITEHAWTDQKFLCLYHLSRLQKFATPL